MGYIKDFLGDKPFDELTESERIDLEWALMNRDVQLICVVCFCNIPSGQGNACETHKGQQPNW